MMDAAQQIESLPLVVTRFDTAFPKGPAIGAMNETTWGDLARQIGCRREGPKDGANIVLARFKPEPDGRARRLKQNVLTRTGIALDLETNKDTGEIPPPLAEAVERVRSQGWGGAAYTSHNHSANAPRYRLLLPLTAEIPPRLPAVEVIAEALGLSGVLDRSKLGAASLFYLPSAEPGRLADHASITIDGAPVDAAWIRERGETILAAREAEQARQREVAMQAAEARRAARIAAGLKPTENLIEAIRDRLDMAAELLRHGYQKIGEKYLFSGSETGVPGVHILRGNDGVDRVYSHHAADPLAAANLPAWCGVGAVDVVDVVTILDHAGDRKSALHKLATQFGIGARPSKESEPPPEWDEIPPPDDEPRGNDDTAAEAEQSAKPGAQQPQFPYIIVNPVSLRDTTPPERKWIVPDWLPCGTTTADYGDGGVGKTLLAQQLQTATAANVPWCGWQVHQCRSIGLYCEDDEHELHRRQLRMCAALGVDMAALEPMRWISGVEHDNTLVAFADNGRLQRTAAFTAFEKAAEDHGAELIVIDTAADVFLGNENDRRQVRQFVSELNRLAKRRDAAVLLNAHPSRDGIRTGNLDGGSTAWSNSVRSRWSLARPSGEGEELDTPERILTRRKANYASIGEAIRLRWQNGVLLPVQRPGGFSAMAHQADADSVFLALLLRFNKGGVRVGQSKHGQNWAPKQFASAPDSGGLSQQDFNAAMGRLLSTGRIEVRNFGRPSRPEWGLAIRDQEGATEAPQ